MDTQYMLKDEDKTWMMVSILTAESTSLTGLGDG